MTQRPTIWFAGLALFGLGAISAPAQQNGQNPNKLLETYIASLPIEAISAAEQADLLHMFEEEKLARDVYRVLGQVWSLPVFANIAESEQSHMDLVELMLQVCDRDPDIRKNLEYARALTSDARPSEQGSPLLVWLAALSAGFPSRDLPEPCRKRGAQGQAGGIACGVGRVDTRDARLGFHPRGRAG